MFLFLPTRQSIKEVLEMKCCSLNVNCRQSIRSLALALFLGGFFSSISYVGATDYTIKPGDDYAAAIGKLRAGDKLLLRGGTYQDFTVLSWQIPIYSGSSWSSPITISAYPGEPVTLLPKSGTAAFWFKAGPNNSGIRYWVINGFSIDGRSIAMHGVKLQAARSGETYPNPSFIRVTNSEVKNARESGMLIDGSNHEFLGLNVHHNGSGRLDHGLYLEASNCLIQNSQFNYNSGYGGHNYNAYAGERASNNRWINNQYLGNRDGFGLILSSGSGNIAEGGASTGNSMGSVQVAYQSVSNTTIRNMRLESVVIESGSTATLIENNCIDPTKINNKAGTQTTLRNNSPTACSGSPSPTLPPPTNVDVTQNQPPVIDSQTSQPSGPSTSQVAMPFLVLGVLGAALLLGD